jgi:glycosyltransferase involved in cell wall biosynthesis
MLAGLVRSLFGATPASARPYFAFVTDIAEPQRVTPATMLDSTQAGFRLRTMIAARRMAREYPVWLVPARLAAQPGALDALGAPGALFIGRHTTGTMGKDHDAFARLMCWLDEKKPRMPIIADITDDFDVLPLRDSETLRFLSDWQAALLRNCRITVTCNALRESLAARAAHGITVIEDPYEAAELAPWRTPGSDPIRICWFGNTWKTTLPSLSQSLGAILARYPDARFSIELVTAARWEMVRKITEPLAATRPGVEFVLTEWSLEATWRALDHCDFVLLPHAWRDPWVHGKSHNRLVAAIAAGRLALASPIPSYVELGDYAWVDDDLAAGIAWAIQHPGAARERVVRGQEEVQRRFSPAAIAEKWAQALA